MGEEREVVLEGDEAVVVGFSNSLDVTVAVLEEAVDSDVNVVEGDGTVVLELDDVPTAGRVGVLYSVLNAIEDEFGEKPSLVGSDGEEIDLS